MLKQFKILNCDKYFCKYAIRDIFLICMFIYLFIMYYLCIIFDALVFFNIRRRAKFFLIALINNFESNYS